MKYDTSRMTIAIDTREQIPLQFTIPTARKTLKAGDYSLVGFENKIAIKRKSPGDLLSCIGKGRKEFLNQMKALSFYHRKYIVIECNLPYIMKGDFGFTKINPQSVIGTISKLAVEYEICPIFTGGHRLAGIVVEKLLTQYYLKYRKGLI